MWFLALYIFARFIWRARKTLVKIPTGTGFNIKMSSCQYRKSHYADRWWRNHLISTMGFPMLGRWYLYIKSGARQPFKLPLMQDANALSLEEFTLDKISWYQLIEGHTMFYLLIFWYPHCYNRVLVHFPWNKLFLKHSYEFNFCGLVN